MKRTRVLNTVVLMVLMCSAISTAALFRCKKDLNLIWEVIGSWETWSGSAWVAATRMPNANDDVLIASAASETFWTHDGNVENDPLYIRSYNQQGYQSDKPAAWAYCNTLRVTNRQNVPRGLQIDGTLNANTVRLGYTANADPSQGGSDDSSPYYGPATVNIHCTENAHANVNIGTVINDNAVDGTTFLWTQYGGTVSIGSIVLNTSLLSYQLRGGTLTLTGSISGGTALCLNVAGGTLVMPSSGFTSLVDQGTILQADGAVVHSSNVQDLLDVDTTTSPGTAIVRLPQSRQAHGPFPADGVVDVDVTSTVNWSQGREALSYDVYGGTNQTAVADARRLAGDINGDRFVNLTDLVLLGDQWLSSPSDVLDSADIVFSGKVDMMDFSALAETWRQTPDPAFMGNQTDTTYVPVLEHDTTYYWRVDAVNPFHPDSPWFGPLWTFTTRSKFDWVDRKRFPEAYSILTSDHVMYPDNVTDFTMKIDGQRQLFVDDYVIAAMQNLVREFHQPTKYTGNPLPSLSGKPVAVLHDETTGTFRMWYDLHYAESQDGIYWTKPDVGGGDNRILHEDGQIRGFMYNPDIPEPDGRYKLVLEKKTDTQTGEPGGFYLYHSFDGLNWHRQPDGPILRQTVNHMVSYTPEPAAIADGRVFQETDPDHFQARGMGDTSIFQYDPVLKKYTCSARFDLYMPQQTFDELGWITDGTPRMRLGTFLESENLVHWSSPRVVMFPDKFDDPDCQIYGHMGFPYESMWLGLARTLRVVPAGFKQVDLKLAYSRTGRHWLRPRERVPFIPLGGPDHWDADYLGYTKFPPTRVGDELWFYYYGARHVERDNANEWEFDIGLATLRRDGFTSLNGGSQPGRITTRPLTFTGSTLFVNADVQTDGWVKAAVLTRNWEPVGMYELTDSVALTDDTLSGQMVWQSSSELPSPGNTHLRLLFELKNAKLYSFWIE